MRLPRLSSLLLATAFLLAAPARLGLTADEDPKIYGDKPEMNGYKLSDYEGFEKKWRLVTVRYRKDTGEMRFTYANPKAWNALLKRSKDYPDGAVFAKIGIITMEDPAFPSSAVPAGTRRYQLMVRNKKKHAEIGRAHV